MCLLTVLETEHLRSWCHQGQYPMRILFLARSQPPLAVSFMAFPHSVQRRGGSRVSSFYKAADHIGLGFYPCDLIELLFFLERHISKCNHIDFRETIQSIVYKSLILCLFIKLIQFVALLGYWLRILFISIGPCK